MFESNLLEILHCTGWTLSHEKGRVKNIENGWKVIEDALCLLASRHEHTGTYLCTQTQKNPFLNSAIRKMYHFNINVYPKNRKTFFIHKITSFSKLWRVGYFSSPSNEINRIQNVFIHKWCIDPNYFAWSSKLVLNLCKR